MNASPASISLIEFTTPFATVMPIPSASPPEIYSTVSPALTAAVLVVESISLTVTVPSVKVVPEVEALTFNLSAVERYVVELIV